jgi:nicotinamidase-related amidase
VRWFLRAYDPKAKGLHIQTRSALIIIDVQNDFITGTLAIKDAEQIIAPINKLRFMYFDHIPTFISQDFHPKNHMSFCETHGVEKYSKKTLHLKTEDDTTLVIEQYMWPAHCVKNTDGVEFHKDLILTKVDKFIQKGTKKNVESYSAFGDQFNGKYENTYLEDWLKNKDITDIILTGLATDYCVYNTALDALRLGYTVHLIMTCTRGFDEGTTRNAINDMTGKGVLFYDSVDKFYGFYKEDIIYSSHVKK